MFKGLTKYDSVQKEEFAKLRNNETIAICYWNKILNKKYAIFLKRFPLPRAMYQNFVFFPTQYLVSFFTTFFFAMRRKNKFIQLFGALEAAQVELTCWICSITQVICMIFFVNCAFLLTNMIIAKEISRNIDK